MELSFLSINADPVSSSFQSGSAGTKAPRKYPDWNNWGWTAEVRNVIVMLAIWSFSSRRSCGISSYSSEVYTFRTRRFPSHSWSVLFFWKESRAWNGIFSPDSTTKRFEEEVLLRHGWSHIVEKLEQKISRNDRNHQRDGQQDKTSKCWGNVHSLDRTRAIQMSLNHKQRTPFHPHHL